MLSRRLTATVRSKEIAAFVKGYADKGLVSKQLVLLKVRFVESIDKTSVGKVSKVTLREKYTKQGRDKP